jgi:hypothetical protein
VRRPPALALLAVVLVAAAAACTGTDSASVSQDGGTSTTRPAATSTASTTTAPATVTARVATWKLPAPLSRTACAVDGSSVRCFSGLNAAKTSTSNILTIDPGAGSAAVSGRIATAVHDAAGAEFAGRALLVGGGAHEVGTTAVVAVTATTSARVGAMPEPRSDLSAVVAGSRLIVLGGYDGTNITPGVLSSTDGVTFTRIGTLTTPVRYGAAVAVGDRVYVFGGKTREGGADSQTSDIQAIDVAAGTVTVVGHFPQAMGHMVAAVLGGGIYVMGGRSGTGVQLTDSAAVWRFDPSTGAVIQVAELPAPLTDSTVAAVGDTAYLIGGERSGTPLSQVVTVTATG